MLSWIREKFGTVVIGGIITFIAFVFVFYGVFSPKSTRGLHEGAVAGTVNGDPITISDFNRELNRRIEFFKNIGGGKISDDQLKAFKIREGVFQELVNRKLMAQEAERQGLIASDEEVKEKIKEIPAFQKEGKFDVATYRQVLEANHYTPSSFERLVREDVSLQQWEGYFRDRVRVGEAELKREFQLTQDKRNIKYILLSTETTKDSVKIEPAEIQKFLADTSKQNLAKMKFDEGKDTAFKGQKFDAVKESIARNILASEKTDEIQKLNSKLADEVVAVMTSDKGSDAKVNGILKAYNVQVKSTGLVTQQNPYLPGIGEAKELMTDAFAAKSPIDSKAKKYQLAGRVLVAVVTEAQKPEFAKFDTERSNLYRQIAMRKSRDLYQEWMKKLSQKAKIDANPAVVSADAG